MAEVAVAFPNDEASAEVIATRLRDAGIAARVDRGLHASWQVAAAGQITVVVDARQAATAHEILGTSARPMPTGTTGLRIVVFALSVVLALGILALAATILAR